MEMLGVLTREERVSYMKDASFRLHGIHNQPALKSSFISVLLAIVFPDSDN